jgi:hypothetical protein
LICCTCFCFFALERTLEIGFWKLCTSF